jgi:hypothetical protein
LKPIYLSFVRFFGIAKIEGRKAGHGSEGVAKIKKLLFALVTPFGSPSKRQPLSVHCQKNKPGKTATRSCRLPDFVSIAVKS